MSSQVKRVLAESLQNSAYISVLKTIFFQSFFHFSLRVEFYEIF